MQTTQKLIKFLLKNNFVKQITFDNKPDKIAEKIFISHGRYGINGLVCKDSKGEWWGIAERSSLLFQHL